MSSLPKDPLLPRLGGDLSIRSIRALAEQLRELVEAGDTEVDCADVRSADTAALQLILVWRRHTRLRGAELRLRHPSRQLVDAATLAGVAAEVLDIVHADQRAPIGGAK